MTVYVVALSKGGSTKTTTAAELVAGLARAGRRVVGVDLDQQGNLTTRLGVTDDDEVEAVAADVLTGEATLQEAAVVSTTVPGAWVVAGTDDLTTLDTRPEVLTSLQAHLREISGEWDDVVIDTPPSLGILTLAGLASADVVVASVACEAEAYDQLGRLVQVLETRISRTRIKPGQTVHWVIPTKYDPRRLLDRGYGGQLRHRLQVSFDTTWSELLRLVEVSFDTAMWCPGRSSCPEGGPAGRAQVRG